MDQQISRQQDSTFIARPTLVCFTLPWRPMGFTPGESDLQAIAHLHTKDPRIDVRPTGAGLMSE